ncbi:hypothetical protein Btru_022756 [Bulinus truncatus]|nr:hypothetical protein Btru_022756 [Bulinus truncatus]
MITPSHRSQKVTMATFHKTLRKHIFLHPSDMKRKYHAVKSTLLRDKQKYSDRLEGALLNVDSLKIVGDRHLIVEGYHSMEVIANFHIFSPRPGQVLEGVINKRSKSHIGCLVLNTFNAVLTQPPSCDLNPAIGSHCSFEVTEVVVDGELIFMRGTLQSVSQSQDSVEMKVEKVDVVEESEEQQKPILSMLTSATQPRLCDTQTLKKHTDAISEPHQSSNNEDLIKQEIQEIEHSKSTSPQKKRKFLSSTPETSIKVKRQKKISM